jgi:hypothetical protein
VLHGSALRFVPCWKLPTHLQAPTLPLAAAVLLCRKGEAKDLVGRLLGEPVKCYTTPCIQAELKKLGKEYTGGQGRKSASRAQMVAEATACVSLRAAALDISVERSVSSQACNPNSMFIWAFCGPAGTRQLLKRYPLHKCGHDERLPASDCLLAQLGAR